VCVLQCEISKSSKQDDQFKIYLKNNTDGVIVYALESPDRISEDSKIDVKMVNDVFTKLTEIQDKEKSNVGG
jgi:hypothetical protein